MTYALHHSLIRSAVLLVFAMLGIFGCAASTDDNVHDKVDERDAAGTAVQAALAPDVVHSSAIHFLDAGRPTDAQTQLHRMDTTDLNPLSLRALALFDSVIEGRRLAVEKAKGQRGVLHGALVDALPVEAGGKFEELSLTPALGRTWRKKGGQRAALEVYLAQAASLSESGERPLVTRLSEPVMSEVDSALRPMLKALLNVIIPLDMQPG